MLLLFVVNFVLHLSCEKNENNKKALCGYQSSMVTSAPTILRPKHKIDACFNKFVVEIEIETVIVVGMRKGTYFKNTVNGCCSK